MFANIAPVAPHEVLAALERAVVGPEAAKACKAYLDILRSLAYDPALFARCIAVMVDVVVADDGDERLHGAQLVASLFHLCLSGTHATIDQRLAVIEGLVGSPDSKRRALGVLTLKAALEAWQGHPLLECSRLLG